MQIIFKFLEREYKFRLLPVLNFRNNQQVQQR